MKIGILTFHRSINYGAVTQCYALAKQLEKDFPDAEIEVIDYVPKDRLKTYKPTLISYWFQQVSTKNSILLNIKTVIAKCLETILHPEHLGSIKERYTAFSESIKCLPLSCETLMQKSAEDFRLKIKGLYDVIVVGSDCVWKWGTVPLPNAYYLPGDFGATKVSFAASCGTDDPALLPTDQRAFLKEVLSDFAYIGVRDTSTEYMVKTVSDRTDFYHNCDPTTLLDPADLNKQRECVKRKLLDAGIDFTRPIVGLMCNETLGRLARDIFGDSVQYVGVYHPNSQCDVFLADLPVLEWAAIFGLFDLTFTSFFHGTMLSLVNRTPVLSFDYLPETDTQITKLHELYNRLDLPEFYHRGKRRYEREDIEEIGGVAHKLLREPPKEQIAAELMKEAQSYESFKLYLMELKEKENL